ncbi:MAG: hypothetical protein ACN4GM_01795, partial [Gammaproteobacteria bacterium]
MQLSKYKKSILSVLLMALLSILFGTSYSDSGERRKNEHKHEHEQHKEALDLIKEGKQTFRFDTFGDERFWGDQLRLHEAIAGEANGGVGPGISPATALALGLKVDVQALPKRLRKKIKRNKVDLDDPATTIALLQLDAVVGVKGFFNNY